MRHHRPWLWFTKWSLTIATAVVTLAAFAGGWFVFQYSWDTPSGRYHASINAGEIELVHVAGTLPSYTAPLIPPGWRCYRSPTWPTPVFSPRLYRAAGTLPAIPTPAGPVSPPALPMGARALHLGPPAALLLILTLLLWRIDRRPPPGHCPRCRYNLTGNTTGICPECGLAVASKEKPK